MTIRLFLLTLLAALTHALLTHVFGEASRFILGHFVPSIPRLVCTAIGLVFGVTLIEVVALLRQRRIRSRDML